MVKFLLDGGANVNHKCKVNNTCLILYRRDLFYDRQKYFIYTFIKHLCSYAKTIVLLLVTSTVIAYISRSYLYVF